MATVTGLDVSSHQSGDLSWMIAQYGAQHVVVKLYLPQESIPQEYSREQVQSARDNGATVGGYVWCYRSLNPEGTILDTIRLCESMSLELPILWLDCETYRSPGSAGFDPGPDAAWLRKAIQTADSLGVRVGMYTGEWWIDGHFPGGKAAWAEFMDYPHWLAKYDGIPSLDPWNGFSASVLLAGKQYAGSPVDQNIWLHEYTVLEEPPPPADDCTELQAEYDHLHAQLEAWRDARPFRAVTKKQLRALLA